MIGPLEADYVTAASVGPDGYECVDQYECEAICVKLPDRMISWTISKQLPTSNCPTHLARRMARSVASLPEFTRRT